MKRASVAHEFCRPPALQTDERAGTSEGEATLAPLAPTGQTDNPITRTRWEQVGAKPDLAVPAADAQKVGHAALLRELIKASTNPEEQADLQDTLAKVEADALDPPVYVPQG
ncbi:hypothetical protein [Aquimonas sp.]|jgi:hypothetical protein|uniref:hypothetical protein n=1 Tax=Aquimonas sp. TaxID=1872588 RepID=UPI0037C1ADC7